MIFSGKTRRNEYGHGSTYSRDLREELALFRDEIRTHYATKADLSDLETRLIKWMIGLMVGSIAVATSIAVSVQMFTG